MQRSAGVLPLSILFALAALMPAVPRPATACGMIVFAEHEERPGGMSDQEVLMVLGENGTMVAVSVGFVDAGDEFAFLLPVPMAPASVLDAPIGLFDGLYAALAPEILIEDTTVVISSGGGGCGCMGPGGSTAPGAGASEVFVVDRGETATYDYVVVGGSSGDSIHEWLTGEGFAIPGDVGEALQSYADEGWLFLAASVRPDAELGHLAPLELGFGPMPIEGVIFPLGLSAYSLPPDDDLSVALTLVSVDQVLPTDYASAVIDPVELVALSSTESNFEAVFETLVDLDPRGQFVVDSSQFGHFGAVSGFLNLPSWAAREGVPETEYLEFSERVHALFDVGEVRVVRLRSNLSADQLRDTGFEVAPSLGAIGEYWIRWYGPGSTDPLGVGYGVFALLLGVFVVRRRRT